MLLDTSGLFSMVDADDRFHSDAVELFAVADTLLLHNYILSELPPLANSRGFPRRKMLSFMERLEGRADVEVVWVGRRLHLAALDLLSRRLDKNYSLCDAVSFVLMRDRGLVEALTTDHHFEQEGFTRLLG